MMAILPRRSHGEDFGGTFLPKKGGQRQLFCKSQGVGLRRNKYPGASAAHFAAVSGVGPKPNVVN